MARTAAMLNFDMVGRLGGGRLRLGGVASGAGLREAVDEAARALPAPRLPLDVQNNPHGPSDHASFYAAGVPVLFFYTGSHADYHEPTDTAEKIDADGIARISALALGLVERLGGAPRPA
jgi:Zn-dependent M28 family amino/carboxypeptidase